MVNSRQKGKRGELQLAHFLQDYGFDARRGQQFSGLQGDADVVGCPHLHLEVKAVEKLNLQNASEQSERDAREGEIPVVIHKRNRKPWYITLRLEDFMPIYMKWLDDESIQKGKDSMKARYRVLKARSRNEELEIGLRTKAQYMAYGLIEAYSIIYGEVLGEEE